MTKDFDGKVAFVTGAASGIGAAVARQLAQRGAKVVVADLKLEAGQKIVDEIVAAGGTAVAVAVDVGRADQVEQAVKFTVDTYGALHLAVNNAGIGINVPFAETTEAQFDELVNVQFKGVFFLSQKLLPLMADGGRIVNISTGLTRFTLPNYGAYAAMKGAVEVYTRYLAKELGPRRITVNTIAPGPTATDFGGGSLRDDEQVRAHLGSVVAMGHVGEPDDIGTAVAALASDAMGWVTGQRIEASGGMLL